jgi:hypothetical protein
LEENVNHPTANPAREWCPVPLAAYAHLNSPARGSIVAVYERAEVVELVLDGGEAIYLDLAEARRLVFTAGFNLAGRQATFDGKTLLVEARNAAA